MLEIGSKVIFSQIN